MQRIASIFLFWQFEGAFASVGPVATQNEGAAAGNCYGARRFTREVWPYCHQINEDMAMYYKVTDDSAFLMLGLHAAGHTGWSALALSGNGGMKGASFVVVRKDETGNFVAEDRFALDYVTPLLDEEQNTRLMFAEEEGGGTSWGVLMPMKTCDDDDYSVEDIGRIMLWAKSSSASHNFGYHGAARGQMLVNLVSGPATPPDFSGLDQVEVRVDDLEIVNLGNPIDTSAYKCQIFDLGELLPDGRTADDKQQAVKISPKFSTDSAQYVHHMILYECSVGTGLSHGHVIHDCFDMPTGCVEMKFAWTLGGGDAIFPSDVAMPFGEGRRWLALQMHYYNPNLDLNVRDSSGVHLTLASASRPYDAGNMLLNSGTFPGSRATIPPGQAEYHLSTFIVPPECTGQWTQEINLLGVIHHMHQYGSTMQINVVRDGSSVGILRRERRYDFNHQGGLATSISQLQPGDRLDMDCWYDTSSKVTETAFGTGSDDEMCVAFITYYPRQERARGGAAGYDPPVAPWQYRTACGTQFEFNATAPNPLPACVPSGTISSPEADAHIREAGYWQWVANCSISFGTTIAMVLTFLPFVIEL